MTAATAKTEATALFRRFLITLVRILVGARSEWLGCTPKPVRRIYFANHGSHVDTIAVMAALPWQVRRRTHPVAARDYWGKTRLHRFIAETVVCAVLIDRNPKPGSNPLEPVERLLERGQSILIFPEGTRAEGERSPSFAAAFFASPSAFLASNWCRSISTISGGFSPREACCRSPSPARRASARRFASNPAKKRRHS